MGKIVPLNIPPGAYRNGTEYDAKGRWRDVNLVRWREGGMRPLAGWSTYDQSGASDLTTRYPGTIGGGQLGSYPRGCFAWVDNSGNKYFVVGTEQNLVVMEEDGTQTDITIAGFGTGTSACAWSFDSFGEIMLACQDEDGRILEWDNNTANNATVVTNAPTSCRGVMVPEENFVFALGASGNPRRVAWSDRGNRTVWTAAATNQAGGFTLDTDGEIQFALQMRGEVLIVTTTDAWVARYVGYPDVWTFNRIGSCKALSKRCGARIGDEAYWMGYDSFYRYRGGFVERIPCAVQEYITADRVPSAAYDIAAREALVGAWSDTEQGEITWQYPTSDVTYSSMDVGAYVTLSASEGWWSYGLNGFSCVLGPGVFNKPLGVEAEGATLFSDTFASDANWTLGTNWQVTGGVLNQTAPTASSAAQTTAISNIPLYHECLVVFTVANRTVGTVTAQLGAGGAISATTNGAYALPVPTGVAPALIITADGTWDGEITGIAVYDLPIKEIGTTNFSTSLTGPAHYFRYGASNLPYAKTGPMELAPGQQRVHVTRLLPDEQDAGELSFTFTSREYPTATETTHGPYTAANPTSVRFSGRQFTMRVAPATAGTDWRSGTHRLEIAPGGKR